MFLIPYDQIAVVVSLISLAFSGFAVFRNRKISQVESKPATQETPGQGFTNCSKCGRLVARYSVYANGAKICANCK